MAAILSRPQRVNRPSMPTLKYPGISQRTVGLGESYSNSETIFGDMNMA